LATAAADLKNDLACFICFELIFIILKRIYEKYSLFIAEKQVMGKDRFVLSPANAIYGTILRDSTGFHFWYTGGSCQYDPLWCPVHEGIGYAFSLDGLTWTKAQDPIFHITDEGALHRSQRTYTPAVVHDRKKRYKMYYSAQSADGHFAIGLATLKSSRRHDDFDD
jgi:hypothetical protein